MAHNNNKFPLNEVLHVESIWKTNDKLNRKYMAHTSTVSNRKLILIFLATNQICISKLLNGVHNFKIQIAYQERKLNTTTFFEVLQQKVELNDQMNFLAKKDLK